MAKQEQDGEKKRFEVEKSSTDGVEHIRAIQGHTNKRVDLSLMYDEVAALTGPLSTTSIKGFPAFPATRLNDPEVRRALVAILRKIVTAVT